jgi:Rrf2 family protein
MMGATERTRYAIHAMLCVARQSCEVRQVEDIARCAGLPRFYTAKVVRKLTRAGLLSSRRGRGGGFVLTRSPDQITLLEIVQAVEGSDWLPSCLLGLNPDECIRLCPSYEPWARARTDILALLGKVHLSDLLEKQVQSASPQLRAVSPGVSLNVIPVTDTRLKPKRSKV